MAGKNVFLGVFVLLIRVVLTLSCVLGFDSIASASGRMAPPPTELLISSLEATLSQRDEERSARLQLEGERDALLAALRLTRVQRDEAEEAGEAKTVVSVRVGHEDAVDAPGRHEAPLQLHLRPFADVEEPVRVQQPGRGDDKQARWEVRRAQ